MRPSRTERQRFEALGVGDVVEHAELVVGPEGGRPPAGLDLRDGHSDDQGVAKLGNSVSPPSTKTVCPVM